MDRRLIVKSLYLPKNYCGLDVDFISLMTGY